MADSTEGLTCPECDEPLNIDEEWRVTDHSVLGETVTSEESIQGDYAHARCMDAPTQPSTDAEQYGGASDE